MLHITHDLADPGVAAAGLTRQRRFIGENLHPGICEARIAALAQQLADLCGQFAARIDQRALDLESRYRCRQAARQLIGGVLQRRPVHRWLGRPVASQARERIEQFIDALPRRRNHRADGDAPQPATQCIDVDLDTAGLGSVRHRQCHQHRETERQQLLDEVQPLVQMGGVDHRQDTAGPCHVRYPAKDDVRSDALFQRMRGQREHARQVDQLDTLLAEFRDAGVSFDRNARIVAGPLP